MLALERDLGGDQPAIGPFDRLDIDRQAIEQVGRRKLVLVEAEEAAAAADFGRRADSYDCAHTIGASDLDLVILARRDHAFEFGAFGHAGQVAGRGAHDSHRFAFASYTALRIEFLRLRTGGEGEGERGERCDCLRTLG